MTNQSYGRQLSTLTNRTTVLGIYLVLLPTDLVGDQSDNSSWRILGFDTYRFSRLIADWSLKTWTLTWPTLKKYMPPPLPYFKVNICPLPLPHFASIFFAYLWSFRWPNYIVTLPRYFSFRLPHLNIATWPPSDELDNNIQRT